MDPSGHIITQYTDTIDHLSASPNTFSVQHCYNTLGIGYQVKDVVVHQAKEALRDSCIQQKMVVLKYNVLVLIGFLELVQVNQCYGLWPINPQYFLS